jgi:hypothetical protein
MRKRGAQKLTPGWGRMGAKAAVGILSPRLNVAIPVQTLY